MNSIKFRFQPKLMQSSCTSWLLQDFTCVSVYFTYSTVYLSYFLGHVLFVILSIFLFGSRTTNIGHNLNIIISLFGLSLNSRIIKPNNNNWNIVCRSSKHRLYKKSFRSFPVPLIFFKSFFVNFSHNLHGLFILNSIPKPITPHNDKIMFVNIETGNFGFANNYFGWILFCLKITEGSSCWQTAWENT